VFQEALQPLDCGNDFGKAAEGHAVQNRVSQNVAKKEIDVINEFVHGGQCQGRSVFHVTVAVPSDVEREANGGVENGESLFFC
jgi:hypothetical protein